MAIKQSEPRGQLFFKQSSELEILISAAIVFAAFNILDLVPELLTKLLNSNVSNNSPLLFIVAILALFLSQLLPISILTHFIFRFYWLSLIGLKTAFKHPNLEKLNYAERYMSRIRKHSDLEPHITTVDKICSSIFAFSFLTLFIFCFSIISLSVVVGAFSYLINNVVANTWFAVVLEILLNLFLLICILPFIDFFTLGALKRIKKKWFVRFYYPISRLMSVITLSYFYRGLYYTFITNIPRRIAYVALPLYLILGILLLNAGFYESRLYDPEKTHFMGDAAVPGYHYQENFNEQTIIEFPFVNKYIVESNHLLLYIPVTEQVEDALLENCENAQAINERGFHWRKWIKTNFGKSKLPEDFNFKTNMENILTCFSDNVIINLNNQQAANYSFRIHNLQIPEKIVFLAVLDISHLEKGDNTVRLIFDDTLGPAEFTIPFYKAIED